MAKDYHVFISHSFDHPAVPEGLRQLLQKRGDLNVVFEEVTPDEPIDSTNADYIKQRLRERIRNSHIVLGLAGIYASHSDWMEWELDTAEKEGIPIVGVIPWGQEHISMTVSDKAVECVRWNTESIVKAIRDHANDPK